MNKWCVINLNCRAYCVRDGKLSWTFDKKIAEEHAKRIRGVVVDAEIFAKNPTQFFNENQPKQGDTK